MIEMNTCFSFEPYKEFASFLALCLAITFTISRRALWGSNTQLRVASNTHRLTSTCVLIVIHRLTTVEPKPVISMLAANASWKASHGSCCKMDTRASGFTDKEETLQGLNLV